MVLSSNTTPPVILLQGPTGSGKSALALALARQIDAEIINADALQVYRDWQILSARPSEDDLAAWPQHLFGSVDASERYSVGRWQTDALLAIRAIQARSKRVVLVGGTGLYFKALTEGLAEVPPIPPSILSSLDDRLQADGVASLHRQLKLIDPQSAARILPTDPTRVVRAIAVFEASGETMTVIQARTRPALKPGDWCGIALRPPRARLYERINQRFRAMLSEGALEEAEALLARGLNPVLPAMKAVGAPPIFGHLRGECSLDDAYDRGAMDTRRYAKRQYTWIGNQVPDWTHIETEDSGERLAIALAVPGVVV